MTVSNWRDRPRKNLPKSAHFAGNTGPLFRANRNRYMGGPRSAPLASEARGTLEPDVLVQLLLKPPPSWPSCSTQFLNPSNPTVANMNSAPSFSTISCPTIAVYGNRMSPNPAFKKSLPSCSYHLKRDCLPDGHESSTRDSHLPIRSKASAIGRSVAQPPPPPRGAKVALNLSAGPIRKSSGGKEI